MKCRNCGKAIDDDALICPYCSSDLYSEDEKPDQYPARFTVPLRSDFLPREIIYIIGCFVIVVILTCLFIFALIKEPSLIAFIVPLIMISAHVYLAVGEINKVYEYEGTVLCINEYGIFGVGGHHETKKPKKISWEYAHISLITVEKYYLNMYHTNGERISFCVDKPKKWAAIIERYYDGDIGYIKR